MTSTKEIIGYILSRVGCLHPFKLSRLLALFDIYYLEKYGAPYTDLKYIEGPGVFFVEGLKELIESDECFVKHEGDPAKGIKGCIEYVCSIITLPEEITELLDRIIDEYGELDDMKLNQVVLGHPLFKELLEKS